MLLRIGPEPRMHPRWYVIARCALRACHGRNIRRWIESPCPAAGEWPSGGGSLHRQQYVCLTLTGDRQCIHGLSTCRYDGGTLRVPAAYENRPINRSRMQYVA